MTGTRAFIVRPKARWVDGRRVAPGQIVMLTPQKAAHEPVDPAPADASLTAARKPRRARRVPK